MGDQIGLSCRLTPPSCFPCLLPFLLPFVDREETMQKTPMNYILFSAFTLAEAVLAGFYLDQAILV